MDGYSLDVKNEKINALKSIFPEIVSEDKIDWERLRATLGEDISISNERYVLNWAGKSDAFRTLQTGSSATLVPAKDESVNFDTTDNIFIEGENLEVLKVLQKAYFGKIKCIIIDPPYNTGNDSFIYPDRFSESKEEYMKRVGDKDEEGFLMKEGLFRKNSKENGQYHSNWLSMMYPRLFLARNLLRDDGVIFVHIDDNEVHNLRLLMNEIFGEENFISQITWEKRYGRSNDQKFFSSVIDYVLLYRKSFTLSNLKEPREESSNQIYTNPDNDKRGAWTSVSFVSQRTKEERPNLSYKITNPFTNEEFEHPINSWKFSQTKFIEMVNDNRLYWGKDGKQKQPRIKRFLSELPEGLVPVNLWKHQEVGTGEIGTKEVDALLGKEIFTFPKPSTLLKKMLSIGLESDDIVIDFFAGSGSTAHAVLELNKEDKGNRKFILVQLPEKTDESTEAKKSGYNTIADISKERIRRVIKKIEEERKPKEQQQLSFEHTPNPSREGNFEMDLGFKVFKLKPSNFKQWRTDIQNVDELTEQLDAFTDPVKPEAEEENMLYELLLKSGYDLNSKIEVKKISNSKYFLINTDELVLQLSGKPLETLADILGINAKKVIMLDRLFENNDQLKTNTYLQFKDAGVDFRTV
ncbi:MAG: site-specific DNA-methyltransferase [bacterium]